MACSRQTCPRRRISEKDISIRTLRDVLEAGDAALQAQLFAPDNSDAMVALNSAMMTDGLVIEVADGAVIPLPLHIVHIASGAAPAAMFTRSLIRVGKHATRDAGGKLHRRRGREGLSGP